MIMVAHPDDELLGPGASMHRLIREYGVKTHVVILGEGITSRADIRDTEKWQRELAVHRENIRQAQAAIGYHSVSIHDLPDNRFDSVDLLDIIKVIEKEKQDFQPEVIFTHHNGDVNIDHKRTFEAVITACRPMAHEQVKAIISFETPSGTEWIPSTEPKQFIPNFYIAVSEENVNAKIKGMESYEFERRAFPHPRSPEALKLRANYWGMTVGVSYAEPFHVVRYVDK